MASKNENNEKEFVNDITEKAADFLASIFAIAIDDGLSLKNGEDEPKTSD